ncbi:hypothetical protein NE865_09499 [Phthorimaea operculella]|nr:hypothetical protein NE865_09499 [Phthorimaea operculella]
MTTEAEEELKRLRLRRGLHKGTVTRAFNFVNDTVKFESSSEDMLQTRKAGLISALFEYKEVHLEILALCPQDPEILDVLEERYYVALSKLEQQLKKLAEKRVVISKPDSSKLPSIEIPVFSGRDFTKYTPLHGLIYCGH